MGTVGKILMEKFLIYRKIPILERLCCVDGGRYIGCLCEKEKSRIEQVESDHEVTAATQKVHCYNEYT